LETVLTGQTTAPFAACGLAAQKYGFRQFSQETSKMSGSVHDKLNRVRKPRVHITYNVETDGAQVERELPFVVGVMGDFSGDPTQPLKPMADRKFAQIDADNFNDVMARIAPGLNMKVDNKLADDGSDMAVNLKFNSMDDFDPARIVDQVPALKSLLDTRNKLRDLMSKADRSDELEGLLEKVLKNEEEMKALGSQFGLDKKEG
jgi:type VI secretion system protein ImpB